MPYAEKHLSLFYNFLPPVTSKLILQVVMKKGRLKKIILILYSEMTHVDFVTLFLKIHIKAQSYHALPPVGAAAAKWLALHPTGTRQTPEVPRGKGTFCPSPK